MYLLSLSLSLWQLQDGGKILGRFIFARFCRILAIIRSKFQNETDDIWVLSTKAMLLEYLHQRSDKKQAGSI
jgi:hypothetical protein